MLEVGEIEMTAIILHFYGHRRRRCPGTSESCLAGYCALCTLYACERCGGAEGTLPRDCPGAPMTEGQQRDVYEGRLEFHWREGWTIAAPSRKRAR
jgi:hypothetical protein